MLSSPALHEEIGIAEKVCADPKSTVEDLLKVQIKLTSLLLKLTHNVRTNQTVLMKHQGIKLKEADRNEEKEK